VIEYRSADTGNGGRAIGQAGHGNDSHRDGVEWGARCIRPGGITILDLRDYVAQERPSPQLVPYGFRLDGGDRYFVVQTRDWDGDFYDVAMYFIREGAVRSRRR
jgi:hypothetical protein